MRIGFLEERPKSSQKIETEKDIVRYSVNSVEPRASAHYNLTERGAEGSIWPTIATALRK